MKSDTKVFIYITISLIFVIFLVMFIYWQLSKPIPFKLLIGSFILVGVVGGILIYVSSLEKKSLSNDLEIAEESFKTYWKNKTEEDLSLHLGRAVSYSDELSGKEYFGFLFNRVSGKKKGVFIVGIVEGRGKVHDVYDVPPPQLMIDPLFYVKRDILMSRKEFLLREKKETGYAVPTVPVQFPQKEPEGDFDNKK